jgi:alkylation response protein AidB-like acyl-CoA dehydrogenase
MNMLMFDLEHRVREMMGETIPLPAIGSTAVRLRRLYEAGREDLSVAKLIEAHWDAIAILAEAGREYQPDALYAVWASDLRGNPLTVSREGEKLTLTGSKMFCTGGKLIDHALITINLPERWLIDLDLRHHNLDHIHMSDEPWSTVAFGETQTSMVTFNEAMFRQSDIVGEHEWYFCRKGFWQGAIGPAACWGGGASKLLDFAMENQRKDPHTLVHLAAMSSNSWAIQSLLETAGNEIDAHPQDDCRAQLLALKTRHLIEQLCTDTIRRFARAYGPFPLACNAVISRHYQELDLFLRQCHAERDLENLGAILAEVKRN